jgi:hypothetical protein
VAFEAFKADVGADDYRLPFQRWVKRLLHRNEEGIRVNMERTPRHQTGYKLADRPDKADFPGDCYRMFLGSVAKNS